MKSDQKYLTLSRILIGAVLLSNVQAAVLFLLRPQAYAPAYELPGPTGPIVIRSLAILFLMWNVPYVIALLHPIRHRISLYEAAIMQTIGVAGETLLLTTIPAALSTLRSSILRFILSDGVGLILLLLAVVLVRKAYKSSPKV